MIGKRFGNLVIKSIDDPYVSPSGNSKTRVVFECDCGKRKSCNIADIKRGKTKSCGCNMKGSNHGMVNTKTYSTWRGMKERCSCVDNISYKYYGGRGISYDKNRDTFAGFYNDMGERPNGMTLDRIDSNGNYCKENCRWVDNRKQSRNKSNSVIIDGRNICDILDSMGIKYGTFYSYMRYYGIGYKEALEFYKNKKK